MIPQHFIDDLIARADIAEVIGRHVQLKKAGREYKACCPFHDEKTPSFTVSPEKGFYHCFGCGAHGTAIGFLMEYEHLSFVEAIETLASMLGIEVPRDERERPAQRHDELYELMRRVERHYQESLKTAPVAVEYLRNRGIDGATAKRFGIGYAADSWSQVLDKFGQSPRSIERLLAVGLIIRRDNGGHYDRFRGRVVFPIRDSRGRTIGFGGRVIGNDEPKYLNSPETVLFHKGRELYGLYEARQALRQIDRLVIVEGYMDVVGLARAGLDNSVATLGTATTPDHLNRLFRLTDNVCFAFDGDAAGRKAAWRALENALPLIREGREVRFVFLPDKHDPDSFVQAEGANAFESMVRDGMPLSQFLIDELAGSVDLGSVDGRARLAERAGPLLRRVPKGVYRELLLSGLAERVGLAEHKLEALLVTGKEESRQQPSARTKIRPAASSAGRPSLIRQAITLLLHEPSAAVGLDAGRLETLERPGVGLLKALVETVQADPNISTAGLLERFRHHDEGRYLGRLAAKELPYGESFDVTAELTHCWRQLAAAADRERVNFLIEKQRVEGLSEAELDELRELGNRAKTPPDEGSELGDSSG